MSSHSRQYNEKSPSNQTKEIKKITKLFITNMNSLIPLPEMQAKLRALFSKHGDILDLQVKENTNKRYSFAFLEMKDPEIITTILEKYNGYELQGRKLRIEYQKSNPREFSSKPFDKPKNNFKNNNFKNDRDNNRTQSPHKWKNFAAKKEGELKDNKDSKQPNNNDYSRREPFRKKSVSPDERKRSKEKTTTKVADYSKPQRANSRQKGRDHKPANNDKCEKKYSRHSSSSESSYSHRRDKKYSHSKNTSSRHHDDRKYPHKRDRSESRDKKYSKDQEGRYRRDSKGRYDRNNKRTRERRKGDSSSSRSSSSSYDHRRRDDRKPDKKSKKFNKNERSYSPYEKRNNYK